MNLKNLKSDDNYDYKIVCVPSDIVLSTKKVPEQKLDNIISVFCCSDCLFVTVIANDFKIKIN